ncbi:MAG TPA: hypothetical protein V6C69_07135 [Trichormus sp.]|jgi:hypothetical protein
MGSRANYAIISDTGAIALHYSNWGGQYIEGDMLWGPDVVIPFIQALEKGASEEILLDTTWCEGCAVVDIPKNRFLVFGGETIGRDPLLRNLWMKIAKAGWEGWTVDWAYHGIADMADALGVPRQKVLTKLNADKFDPTKLYACHTQGGARMLLSFRDTDGSLKHFGFDAPVEYYFAGGEALVGCLNRCKPYSIDPLAAGQNLPEDAIYIDAQARKIVVTVAPVFGNYDPRLTDLIASGWPGWSVELNYNGLRQHPEVCDLDFRIPQPSNEEMMAELRRVVCRQPILIGHHLKAARAGEPIKPAAHVVPLSEKERTARFNKLVAKCKRNEPG